MAKQVSKTATPRLRFPEFRATPEWRVKRMDRLYAFMRNNLLSRDKLNYEAGPAKNIHYGDIHTKFPVLFDITKERVPFVSDAQDVAAEGSEDYCIEGDVIFADASEDMNDVGKAMEVIFLNGERLLSGQHTILARRKDESLIIGFGGYLFRSGLIRSRIQKEAQGTKVYQISSSRLGGIDIAYPADTDEQKKIADCLTSLDEVIAAQGRKVEALKAHKRGLMQQLFPREGETRPRLRFPEFRDAPEWELKTLSSVCEMQAGKFVSASEISDQPVDGRFPCYGGNGLRGYTSSFTHSGTFPLIGRQGALCGNVQLAEGDFYATEHALVVSPKRGVVVPWLYYTLGKLELNRFATGQAQPGLSVDVLKAVECSVPATELEQQRIADCLTSVDMQIAAESNQLAALKTHKQGLMQQLFPAPEATGA